MLPVKKLFALRLRNDVFRFRHLFVVDFQVRGGKSTSEVWSFGKLVEQVVERARNKAFDIGCEKCICILFNNNNNNNNNNRPYHAANGTRDRASSRTVRKAGFRDVANKICRGFTSFEGFIGFGRFYAF